VVNLKLGLGLRLGLRLGLGLVSLVVNFSTSAGMTVKFRLFGGTHVNDVLV